MPFFKERTFEEQALLELTTIRLALAEIIRNQEAQQVTEQSNVDALTADLTQIDADEKANAAAIAASKTAFDTAIAGLQQQIADGQAPDLTQLLAARAVLDGDHPDLESAVTALSGDPAIAQPAPSSPAGQPSAS